MPNFDRWLGVILPPVPRAMALVLALGTLSVQLGSPAHSRAEAVAQISEFLIPTVDSEPTGIAVGPDGNVWFTESKANKIGRITATGEIKEFPIPTAGSEPVGITTGPANDIWFTERRGDKIGRITATGEIKEFPLSLEGSEPTSIAAGPPGHVSFTVPGRNTYYEMAPGGEICAGSGSTGDEPLGIAAGPEGDIWLTDVGTNRIDQTERGPGCSGGALFNPIPTAHSHPVGLTAGPDGEMWFTEEDADQIGRFNIPQRAFTEFPVPTKNARPAGITTLGGELWFTEKDGNKVGRLSPEGRFNQYAIPTDAGEPTDIASGPEGGLWFTESRTGKIGRLTPPPLPKNTSPPAISGRAEQGQTLSAEPGSWSNTPTSYGFRWEHCVESLDVPGGATFRPELAAVSGGGGVRQVCTPIPGATGQRFVPGPTDVGLELRVSVEANSPGGTDGPAQSAITKRVIALVGMRARASLTPRHLPRRRKRDATLRLGFKSFQAASSSIPSLESIDFEISQNVSLTTAGLSSCRPSTLFSRYGRGCRRSLVGRGEVSAEITLRGRQPTMVSGPMDAYYSFAQGEPRLLAVVHGKGPLPLIYVIPFTIRKGQHSFGTGLVVHQMHIIHGICIRRGCGSPYTISGVYTHIAHFELALHRRFRSHGRWWSLVGAACPTGKRRRQLTFPLAATQLKYSQGTVRRRLVRTECRVGGSS